SADPCAGARRRGHRINRRAPSHGSNGGVADTLDEAKAAFRSAAWERQRPYSPLSLGKSGREMLRPITCADDPVRTAGHESGCMSGFTQPVTDMVSSRCPGCDLAEHARMN